MFRYGGEEFAIVCPTSDAESASQLAERTRRAVADQARVGRHDDAEELSVTCSIGVATHAGDTFARAEQLLKAADEGVYAAKAAGRNCVRYSPSEVPSLAPKLCRLSEVSGPSGLASILRYLGQHLPSTPFRAKS